MQADPFFDLGCKSVYKQAKAFEAICWAAESAGGGAISLSSMPVLSSEATELLASKSDNSSFSKRSFMEGCYMALENNVPARNASEQYMVEECRLKDGRHAFDE